MAHEKVEDPGDEARLLGQQPSMGNMGVDPFETT